MSNIDQHSEEFENLFRNEFDGFEAEPTSSAWNNIAGALAEDKPGFLAQKMGAVAIDVSPSVWDNIEAELHGKRRIIPIWWQWGAAASVLLAIGFYFLMDRHEIAVSTQNSIAHVIESKENTNENSNEKVNENEVSGSAQEKNDTKITNDNEGVNSIPPTNNFIASTSSNFPTDDVGKNNNESFINKIERVIDEHIIALKMLQTDQFLVEIKEKNIERRPFMPYKWDIKKRPEGNSLAGGVGGSNGTEGTGNTYNTESLSDVTSGLGTQNDFSAAESQKIAENQIVYATPFKLNFTFQKGLTQRLSLETGLSYTSLAATGSDDIWNVKSRLHYFGIPLRTNFKLLGKKKIQFYSLQGILFEKGVYQSISSEYITLGTIEKDNRYMKGYQISAELGLGTNYDIAPKLGLYLHGGINYYFKKDTNQPYNIYNGNTMWPSVVAGLRYKLK